MTVIAGASQYVNAAKLANQRGQSPVGGTDVISSLGTVDILDISRSANSVDGIGLSGRARALNKEFLSSTASTFNSIFSLGVSGTSSIEGLQTQINALRSSLPDRALSRELRGNSVDTQA